MRIRGKKWVLIITAMALLTTGMTSSGPVAGSNTVVAYFTDADSLIPGNWVKADGVVVGSVGSVRLDHGLAEVTMTLNAGAKPLHADASAQIRPVSLLGEQYVSLDSGSPNAALMASPAQIPVSRTTESVDVQQVLNTLDTPTSTALGSLVTALGDGVNGNGQNIAGMIKALQPAMTQTTALAAILNQQNGLLDTLIDQAAPVAAAVASDDGKTVDQLVGTAEQTLSAVAANRQALSTAVATLPATLQSARGLLDQLAGVADATTPALKSAAPVTDNLTAISNELRAFVNAGDPALASLQPVLERANGLLDQARPVVSELQAGGPDLLAVARGANQVGSAVVANLDNLIQFLTGWALATAGYDAIGHYFRADVPIDSATIQQLAPSLVPPQLLGGAPGTSSGAAPSQGQPPSSPSAPGTSLLPLLPLPLPLLGSGQAPPSDPGSATGLTQQQENGLLGLIFGGQSG
jgi:phospholipid/cholesterol/gamma-HCH transport system substrate-binding protein